MIVCELPLQGAGGEPISFARTIYSHGVAELPPARIETEPLRYVRALRVGERVVDVRMRDECGTLVADSPVRLGRGQTGTVAAAIARMFRLAEDLSPFYAKVGGDPHLAWAASGAGRMLRSPTVFEDVVKTICTTNCTWSATVRMTSALVELGGGAFPEPQMLARASDRWYAGTARMGYRGPYVRAIARDVAAGRLDLEGLASPHLADDDVERALLALPGIGPYAAAHVMQLLGRYRRLVLDSWTRPKFVRLTQRRRASDATIRKAFARYGDHAGLAFWLFLTRDWLADGENS
jgi:3-methyladenine DNA glycosylase/8-oxoguanine DNA glycosylase